MYGEKARFHFRNFCLDQTIAVAHRTFLKALPRDSDYTARYTQLVTMFLLLMA